jgi:hypothetical protein
MTQRPPSVVLACNFPGDERLGTSRVPLRLADGLRQLGWQVSLLFAADVGGPRQSQLNLATAPARMARLLMRRAGDADVVDIAGFDAWIYARLARRA